MDIDGFRKNIFRIKLDGPLEREYLLSSLRPKRQSARQSGIIAIIGLICLAIAGYVVDSEAYPLTLLANNAMWTIIVIGLAIASSYLPEKYALRANWLLVPGALWAAHVYFEVFIVHTPIDRQMLTYTFSAFCVTFSYMAIFASFRQLLSIGIVASSYLIYRYNQLDIFTTMQFAQVVAHFVVANLMGIVFTVMVGRGERLSWVLTRDLEARQAESEQLLQNILPAEIASRLKKSSNRIADLYADVTVGFADIVGFTELASRVSPHHLVGILHELFGEFDRIVQVEGGEKVKMIGDAYMFVVGAPTAHPLHAEIALKIAQQLHTAVQNYKKRADHDIDVRVGLATGTAIGGVICEHKFAFDLWGDTVNVAARMEQSALPGTTLLASSTYDLVASDYPNLKKHVLQVKGKGEMEVYELAPNTNPQPFPSSLAS